MLAKPVRSMPLELDNIEMDSDDSSTAFLPKTNEKREIRAIFDLILNILDTIRSAAKNDVKRAKKRELSERSLVEIEYQQ